MKLLLSLAFLIHFSTYYYGHCTSDNIQLGSQFTLVAPLVYIGGFVGRAFVMETSQPTPNFRAGLTIEAVEDKYLCSFDVFLGDFKVWSSGHFSRFFTTEKCVLGLTMDGDLLLMGHNDRIGWRTATFGQGIKRLQLSNTGNLVLVDEFNMIKWQSFHFPTNVMLWGQRLDVGTRLTSFPTNSTLFYSFEIERERIALYLNSGKWKYSYWEFKPHDDQKITSIRLASKGLQIFNDDGHKVAQIPSKRLQLLRFLALGNSTGNLGLYYYSTASRKFEASFEALRSKCDLPMACEAYGICTFSKACSCLQIDKISQDFCGKDRVDMVDLRGASNVLRDVNMKKVNVSKETCADLCVDDCTCVAALFTSEFGECFLYGEVRGVKQVDVQGNGELSYMVKVLKNRSKEKNGKGLKKWALVLIVVSDGLILFLCLGGIGFYLLRKRRKETNPD